MNSLEPKPLSKTQHSSKKYDDDKKPKKSEDTGPADKKDPPNDFTKVIGGRVEKGTKILDSLLKGSKQEIINLINGDGVNAINMIKSVVLTGVSCIPYIGGLLSSLMDIIWSAFSSSKVDIAEQFKKFIDQEVRQKIEEYDLDSLKSRYQGICNVMSLHNQNVQSWLQAHGDKSTTETLRSSFESIDENFSVYIEEASKDGHEISEMVYYVLIATSHIALVSQIISYHHQLGYDSSQCNIHKKRLTDLTETYTKHCVKFYQEGYDQIKNKMEGDNLKMLYETNNYNRLLKYESFMKNNVFDFVNMWWSMDVHVRYLYSRICGDVNSLKPKYDKYPPGEEFLHASIDEIHGHLYDKHYYRGEFAGMNGWCGARVTSIQSSARRTLKAGDKEMDLEFGNRVGNQSGFLVKTKDYNADKPLESLWVGSEIVPFNMNIDGVTFGNHDGRATQYKLELAGHKVGYVFGFGNCMTNGFDNQLDAMLVAFIPKSLKWRGFTEITDEAAVPIDAQLYNDSDNCQFHTMNSDTLNLVKLAKGAYINYHVKYTGKYKSLRVKIRPRATSDGTKNDKCVMTLEFYINGVRHQSSEPTDYRIHHSTLTSSKALHVIRYDNINEYYNLPKDALCTFKLIASGDCGFILSHLIVHPIGSGDDPIIEGSGTPLSYNFYFDDNYVYGEEDDRTFEITDDFYDDVDDVDYQDVLAALKKIHHVWFPEPNNTTEMQRFLGMMGSTSSATRSPRRLILVDKEHITKILEENHSGYIAGHLGITKTTTNELGYFDTCWQNNSFDGFSSTSPSKLLFCQHFIGSCDICQRVTKDKAKGYLTSLEIPTRNWMEIGMDFMKLPTSKNGYDNVLVVVDRLSKMVHLCLCTTEITAVETAKLFFKYVFRYHRLLSTIVSDRDSKFTSDMSTPNRPQTDGQTERYNRTLKLILSKHQEVVKETWDEHLPAVEFAINSAKQASTGLSPFELNFGFEPTTPSNIININNIKDMEIRELISNYTQIARDNILSSQVRQAKYYNKNRKDDSFEKGEEVETILLMEF
ncbi:hypothetical protein PPL_01928 [Heterostelium album PN500]|uniref:Integrase catalytic domain-containing protein n=1 Tax=Heterostelium pallidum (strain ATCC 26659 / Pp 5 / PN500) TaxID=670386 RepID=D3B0W1_HETP5|nr:hypothetical protein PPL_01928 [Heterostelium album PN500]EFA84935.1 hypothetical protein PPL_01928 [Heterostelium album PN500]|eukprot:XP_020437045.1 hypothetical protein PPL_01928 [Heterostelium album PN500]